MNSHEMLPLISICLCTYKRPFLLTKCLDSLANQDYDKPYEIIIVDNDSELSGKNVVDAQRSAFVNKGISISYFVEPIQNIALARNRCVNLARAKYIAFIDDDEYASSHWLKNMYKVLIETNADGVWGAVLPNIPESFPLWMRRSKVFHRPVLKDKSIMNNNGLRTGNALVKKEILTKRNGPFDQVLGRTGGSDSELFNWILIHNAGIKYVWAENAEVEEIIEEKRMKLAWHLIRGYRGGWSTSKKKTTEIGIFSTIVVMVLLRVPLGIIKALILLVIDMQNPKASFLMFARNIAAQLGKIGYFLGIKMEEYKG